MWDLIVSVPDHCLSFYLESLKSCNSTYRKETVFLKCLYI